MNKFLVVFVALLLLSNLLWCSSSEIVRNEIMTHPKKDQIIVLIQKEGTLDRESTIVNYTNLLSMLKKEREPLLWTMTHSSLAVTYNDRIVGDRSKNIELAIDHYHKALEIYTKKSFPTEWAMTHSNLATAYMDRMVGDRGKNIELAIGHNLKALEVYRQESLPMEWAAIEYNLGIAYSNRVVGERSENIESAIECYHNALKMYTKESLPAGWVMTQNNLANAYVDRIAEDRSKNIELAIDHYHKALEIYTKEYFPREWAMTQNNLATAYFGRIAGERFENIELAIAHHHKALEIRTKESLPMDWAETQNNLAVAYWDRILGEKSKNIELSIAYNQRALEIVTKESLPTRWAMTQNNLANAYRDRIVGEKSQNIELAIDHYSRALEIYSKGSFPSQWATTQNNLANTYSDRIIGDRFANIELAIKHFNRALEIFTKESFPTDWATTGDNLAITYMKIPIYDKSIAIYEELIESNEVLLNSELFVPSYQKRLIQDSQIWFNNLIASYLHKGEYQRAFLTLERSKVRLGKMRLARLRAIEMLAKDQREAINHLIAEIRYIESSLAANSIQKRVDTMNQLKKRREQYHKVLKDLGIESLERYDSNATMKALASLPSNYAIVAPFVGDEQSVAFVLRGGDREIGESNMVKLDINATRLNAITVKFFEDAYMTNSVKLNDTLKSLGEYVALDIEKKLDSLEGIKRVIYLPSSYLNYLPLEACGKSTPLSERYIFERSTHLSVPSHKKRNDTHQSLLSIINPTSDLGYASVEGEVVNRLFDKVESLSEQNATKEALSHKLDKGNFAYLYFTGHGSFDMSNPLNSALILSDGNYTIRDMLSQKHYRDIRLAFLSACETNMPDIDMLSEMISIPQALLETGTKRVISTLYQVDERATMFLTIKFFQLYIQQKRDAPQALAMAKVWLRSANAKELRDISIRYMQKYNAMSRDHIKLRQLVEHFTYDFHENDKPYNNPKYWAGFISNGSGVK